MLKHIYVFIDGRGCSPVEDFLGSLTVKESKKFRAYLRILKECGHNLRRTDSGLFGRRYLRVKAPSPPGVLFLFYERFGGLASYYTKEDG